jgi:SAM-dependent methyltransferase
MSKASAPRCNKTGTVRKVQIFSTKSMEIVETARVASSLTRHGLAKDGLPGRNNGGQRYVLARGRQTTGFKSARQEHPLDLLSPEQIEHIVLNLTGREWLALEKAEQDWLVELCFFYWRNSGFPHYEMSDEEMSKEYGKLERTDSGRCLIGREIQIAMAGVKLANYFHPHMWGVQVKGASSPFERFDDDISLRKLIRRALHIWPERKAINDINLRGMLRTFSNTTRVSNFRPTAAKLIYDLFSKDGDTVIDFSAGYGGRLLGCLPLRRNYVGIDPCLKQFRGLRTMVSTLRPLVPIQATVDLRQACAEDVLPNFRAASAALIFSSPPYFDLERYSGEHSQSYIRYPDYHQWREQFLKKIIDESHRVLKRGGHFAINITNKNKFALADDTKKHALSHFQLIKTLKLRLGHKPYLRKRNLSAHKYEQIFVFQKR